jgi:UDP-N-acetylglucosamine 1-carboxyvinyltransferase
VSESWLVHPQGPLEGEIHVSGAKNIATKLMVAALLGEGPSHVENAPTLGDVDITAGMLTALGAGVEAERNRVTIEPSLATPIVPLSYTGLNRIPILLIGPLLHRLGEAYVPLSGGDRIGARPIGYHAEALRSFGAELMITDEGIEAKATQLHGTEIRLPFPSVGATETILLTASRAAGRTVLENAAVEPEVIELALFLQRMGARLEIRPDRKFVIEGQPELRGASQRIGGDRIEALSYLIAGLASGGRVRVSGVSQDRMVTAISILQRMGADVEITDNWVTASSRQLRPAAVSTSAHPGFMTDWHPPIIVAMTQVGGMSVLHETVFEDRFGYVDGLKTMGAEIELFDQCLVGPSCRFYERDFVHSAVVRGPSRLRGAELEIPDVRAGFAYLLAAACAEGTSTLTGVEQMTRGYDGVMEKFRQIGLEIDQIA